MRHCRACNGDNQVLAGVPSGILAELPGGLPGVLPGVLLGVLAQIWPLYLVCILPDPDILIGCGTMSELHRADILVEALGCQLLGTRILICSAECGYKRHGYYEKGIDPESHVEATDLGIRYLLLMAAELFAELSATVLAAVMLADLPLLMLVQLLVAVL